MKRPRAARILIPAALVLIAGLIRVVMLDQPERIIFDETYYVNDAKAYLEHGVEDGFAVHPPVGKWLIAAGIRVLGDSAVGWRISTAIAGTLVVLLTYLIGARLLRWRGAAALAGLLVAVDGLMFVQSRTSMLDIFLALFVCLGAWLLLVDVDRARLFDPSPQPPPPRDEHAAADDEVRTEERGAYPVPAGGSDDEVLFGRRDGSDGRDDDNDDHGEYGGGGPDHVHAAVAVDDGPTQREPDPLPARGNGLRILTGAAFGLAIATKWSGVLAMGAAVLLLVAWELAWRRRLTGRWRVGLGRLAASLSVAFLLVPAAVYVLTYVPWFVNYAHTTEGEKVCSEEDGTAREPCHVSIPGRVQGFWRYQVAISNFHEDLDADHPYRAPAYTWPVMGRPVVYYWENCDENRANGIATENDEGEMVEPEPCVVAQENAAEIIALGNPALWWLALGALVPLGFAIATKDRRAWFIVAFWLVQTAPWMILSLPGLAFSRPLFFFYMTPVVPFLALAVAYGCVWLDDVVEKIAPRMGFALPRTGLTPGAVAGAGIALVAVALFVYFYPVFTGIELDYDAVRQRWWFDSWI